MNKPYLRYALSPALTFLALVLIHLASGLHWFTVSLAFPVGVMALCLFWSGLRANILSALLITAYALYSPYFDLVRSIQVILLAAWPMAVIGGVMRRWLIEQAEEAERQRLRAEQSQATAELNQVRAEKFQLEVETQRLEAEVQRLRAEENQEKAERYDELNGNIERLKRSTDRLWELIQGWDVLTDEQKREIVRAVKNDLANLATAVDGWHKLAQEKKEIDT